MKIVCMIPARSGSQRVKNKNLRYLGNKPLIFHILDTIKETDLFDETYVNSEDMIYEKICKFYNFKFYKRDKNLSSNTSTNDDFAYDFLKNVKCDYLVQILPTSPFLNKNEIIKFVNQIRKEKLDSLISVTKNQIACIYKNNPINFIKTKPNPPSQTMNAVYAYATALMAWKKKTFIKNIELFKSGYHGGIGKTKYFELNGLSKIDIDNEEDFLLAEKIYKSNKINNENKIKRYFDKFDNYLEEHIEKDVPSILSKDGVKFNDLFNSNKEVINASKLIKKKPRNISWSHRAIDTENNSMTIIAQMPGEGNRKHYHPDWNEWWYILEGEWEWEIDNKKRIVKKGDIVFMKKNRPHKITAKGEKIAIRMAVSRSDVEHVYVQKK